MMYHSIYLSPHLDDAALSCGGQIAQLTAEEQQVLIVTLMAGDPPDETLSEFAVELHQRWEVAQHAVSARRDEDVAACQVLGVDYQHWPVPDCIYRRQPGRRQPGSGDLLYENWGQITGEIHPAEQGLVEKLAGQLAGLPTARRVIVPLAAGNHVDHQLVRQAAEICFAAADLVYYEDYPYVRDSSMLTAVISATDNRWRPEVISLTDSAVQAKIEAIVAYRSQLSTFFNGRADLETEIHAFTQATGGERLWRLVAVSGKW